MKSYQSVGIGLGPSNVSLAIALQEKGVSGKDAGYVFF